MSRPAIRILADQVVDQIAAGEVVERPASALKELVENAIDAGATQVVVALRDGGRTLIRVEDDGQGMSEQDALLSIERHATSKIRETADLLSVRSLGFRGEALPSIAAVSEFELVTRRPGDEQGTRVRVDGGRLRDVRPTAAAVGTVVSARKLFYNVPVRQKFLRTVPTELGHCVQAVVRQAMVRPAVGFSIQHGGRTILDAPAAEDWAVRVEDLVGPDGRGLLAIEESNGPMSLKGYVAPPDRHRAHAADATYLYVNGRWTRDHVLRRAVREAYRERMPSGRHPLAVLELRLDPAHADVNVHPTKAEVRFIDPAAVVRFVAHSVASALQAAGAAPRTVPSSTTPYLASSAPLFVPSASEAPSGVPVVADLPPVPAVAPVEPAPDPVVVDDPRWVGVVGGRWGIGDLGDRLFITDLGRLARQIASAKARGPGRPLLVPAVVRLGEEALAEAEARGDLWRELGLVTDRFTGAELAIRSIPESLADVDPAELVRLALSVDADAEVRDVWAEALPVADVTDGPAVIAEAHARGRKVEGRAVPIDALRGVPWTW